MSASCQKRGGGEGSGVGGQAVPVCRGLASSQTLLLHALSCVPVLLCGQVPLTVNVNVPAVDEIRRRVLASRGQVLVRCQCLVVPLPACLVFHLVQGLQLVEMGLYDSPTQLEAFYCHGLTWMSKNESGLLNGFGV